MSGEEIQVPSDVTPSGPTDTNDLLSMVEQNFAKKPEEASGEPAPAAMKPVDKEPEKKEPEPKEEPKKKAEGEFEIPTFDAFIKEPIEKEEVSESPEPEETPEDIVRDTSKETNIKKLRNIVKTVDGKLKTANEKIAELEEKLTTATYSDDALEKIAKLEERNKQLEYYEAMYALEKSPVYQERFVSKIDSLTQEAKKIAVDYDVPEDIVDDLLRTTNSKQLNKILRENINDDDAISDLKGIVRQIHATNNDAKKYKDDAQKSVAEFSELENKQRLERTEARTKNLQKTLQNGFYAALSDNKSLAEPIQELVEIPGKIEHNNKVVKPLLKAANDVTTNVINHIEKLVSNGGEVDANFAKFIATLAQQACATQMINQSRNYIYNYHQKYSKNVNQQRGYERPSMTTPPRSNTPAKSDPKKEYRNMKPDEAAKKIAFDIASSVMGQGV